MHVLLRIFERLLISIAVCCSRVISRELSLAYVRIGPSARARLSHSDFFLLISYALTFS